MPNKLKITEELFEKENVKTWKELEAKYNLSGSSLRRRYEKGLSLTAANYRNKRHKRPKGIIPIPRIRRNLDGEVRSDTSLSWREIYEWDLQGAKEWLEKVKKAPNVNLHEQKFR
jgi:hypothetical protein